jgi:hypothetical protein
MHFGLGFGPNAIAAFASPAWTPALLPSITLYREAGVAYCFEDAGATDACEPADGIYTWTGTPGGTITQAAGAQRPTFRSSPDRAEFDGSGDHLGTYSGADGTSLFTFHRFRTSTAGYHNLYDNHTKPMMWVDGSGRIEADTHGSWLGSPIVTDGQWHTTFAWRSTTVGTRLWVDGVELTWTGPTVALGGPFTGIDLFSRGGGSCFNGDCTHFGFGTALPSSDELASLQAFLTGS